MIPGETHCKTILTRSRLPETDYSLNPYVGCSHACAYCYARFMRRFTRHSEPWGQFVDAKVNAAVVLRHELARVRRPGKVLLGSVTDAYQPAERKYGLTRAMLAELVGSPLQAGILTKSDLVLRDLDLLKQLKDCTVGLTITTLDEGARRHFEPGASSVEKRLAALRLLHENGIANYVFVGPILPGLTDLRASFGAVRGTVDSVWGEALNLRCGNRAAMELVLRQHYPHLLEGYRAAVLDDAYWAGIGQELNRLSEEFGVPMVGYFRH